MTHTTLDNWQAQLTAKGLSHNETVRLLQDARKQIDAQKAQNAVDREAAQALTCVISDIAALVGIRDSAPNLCRETVKAVKKLTEERDALRAALQPLADMAQYVDSPMYTQDRYVAGLNTVEHYHEARRVLGEVKG